MNTNEAPFALTLKVRDYECDMQGIVNNAVYMNYFEHARHEYLNLVGLNFKLLIEKDVYFVAVKSEIVYKHPLRSGDEFIVHCTMKPESRTKIVFEQSIFSLKGQLHATGKMYSAAINKAGKILKLKDVLPSTFSADFNAL